MSIDLELTGVRAGYGNVEVLHGVELAVPARGITALLGRNGAGKSTTLAAVAGLLPVRSGVVSWGGVDVTRWSVRRRAAAGMLLVPERRGIFADLSVADNLELFAVAAHERARLPDVHAAFPVLQERLEQRAGSLSGGEQQMLALSRVLVQRPRLLLLDEVSFGLAPQVTGQLFDVVAQLSRSCTVLLVEQYVDDALRLADVVYVLDRGAVAFAGESGELRGKSLPLAR
ncbi:MAG: branched-chain amino acid transport system ATP-binding protein [Actinomycetota bacterium]|jgi:branched-chain amino acid transport system ATP-binding protein|nr:branched-chain amino acid transport system ATP-binding protein [Actinomycetota bacterium]